MDQAEIDRPPMKKRMRGGKRRHLAPASPVLAAPVHTDSPYTFRFPDSQQAARAELEPARPATAAVQQRPPTAALRPVSACQWPSGDKGQFRFVCDEPAKKDRPYCADHCKLAYETLPPRKDR
jgi:hypothetical protein